MTEAATLTLYHYPNKMGRIVLMAMEEVLGRNGINAVLDVKGQHDSIQQHIIDTIKGPGNYRKGSF